MSHRGITERDVRWHSVVEAVRSMGDDQIRRIVRAAKPHALRVCLYQLTRDPALREIAMSTTETGSDGISAGTVPVVVSGAAIEELRSRAFDLLSSYRSGTVDAPLPTPSELLGLVGMLFGFDLPESETEFWWEEFAAVPHPRGCDWFGTLSPKEREQFTVLVIGAGMNGITTAVNLERAGISYSVVDRNDGVGGTWHANVYPGARVDFTSRAYSYTWEPDWPWKHYFAPQEELKAYFEHIVDKYEVRPHLRLSTEVTAATWDEGAQQWTVDVTDLTTGASESISANVIVSAIGIFSRPKLPAFPGMDEFTGRIVHSSQWDPEYDLTDKRVAIVGTGSSGVQALGPIAERAGHVQVFQRSGTWIDPVPNYVKTVTDDEQWLLDHLPYYLNWERLLSVIPIGDYRVADRRELDIDPEWKDPLTISATNKALRDALVGYLMEKVGDRPDLVERCIPDYPPATKRLPKDNGWFDALRKEHVELITDPIVRFTASGIETASGVHHEVDLVMLATGFQASEYLLPINFVGRGGVTIAERWQRDGARAYLGIAVPGFPNLFCLYGPNTNGRASSPCGWGELQSRFAMESIKYLIDHGLSSMDVKPEVYEAYNRLLDERTRLSPWMDHRQTSYYRNEFGRSATNGPFFNQEYWPWTRRPNPDEFEFSVRST